MASPEPVPLAPPPPAPPSPDPLPPEQPRPEDLRREIEAIRAQIAANEQLLGRTAAPDAPPTAVTKTPSLNGEGDQAAPAPQVGYYVYGITPADEGDNEQPWPQHGIDPAHAVCALPYQGIQAVVSRVSLDEFAADMLEENLQDRQWLEPRVRVHQEVLTTILSHHTIVPMRFCTIYHSENGVREMLIQYYQQFVDALAQLEGRQEWGIKMYCDRSILADQAARLSTHIQEMEAQSAGKSGGASYFLKKKLQEATEEEVTRLCDEHAQRSHDRLGALAEGSAINSLQSKQVSGRPDEMALNAAYLVSDAKLDSFMAEIAEMRRADAPLGFSFELTGPWPPYNFAIINLEDVIPIQPVPEIGQDSRAEITEIL
jgi:hypothetical protein